MKKQKYEISPNPLQFIATLNIVKMDSTQIKY